MNAQNKTLREETYKKITDAILKALEKGTVPWLKTWTGGVSPSNAITKKPYRGINRILLSCAPYTIPYYATINQITKLGGTVSKDELPWEIVFWQFKVIEETDPKTGKIRKRKIGWMKLYSVYNLEQADGIDMSKFEEKLNNVDNVFDGQAKKVSDTYLKKYNIKLSHGGGRAFYSPPQDSIRMPALKSFTSGDEYASTLFHEEVHSTGAVVRLKREGVAKGHSFGDHDYSFEELIAEMGASFLSSLTGISNESMLYNSASYIDGWRKKISDDPSIVVDASGQAQKAVDFIISCLPTPKPKKVVKKQSRKPKCKWCTDDKIKQGKLIYPTTITYDNGILETKGNMCEAHREAWWMDGYDVSFVKGKTTYELS